MKAKTNAVLIVVALLAYWVGLSNASAFYDPGTQRWLNRDPLGDKGFSSITKRPSPIYIKPVELHQGPDLYCALKNSPLDDFDVLGLGPGGCGSGWNQPIVPDKPGGYDFTSACQTHDHCYGTCGASKGDCDSQLLENLDNICDNYSCPLGCYEAANAFYGAVQNWGQSAFDAAQTAACSQSPCPTSPSPSPLLPTSPPGHRHGSGL